MVVTAIQYIESESEVTQPCPTLCNPMDCSLPGFSFHGIFQARVLEWVAISYSRISSQPRDRTQASLTITNSWSILKLMSIESVMSSNHLILCYPFLLPPSTIPSIRLFYSESFFTSSGQSIGVSASASVPPMNIQD